MNCMCIVELYHEYVGWANYIGKINGGGEKIFHYCFGFGKNIFDKKFILCIIGKKIGGAYEKINKPIGCVDAC